MKHSLLLGTIFVLFSGAQAAPQLPADDWQKYQEQVVRDRIAKFGSIVFAGLALGSFYALGYVSYQNSALNFDDWLINALAKIHFPGINAEPFVDEKISASFYLTMPSIILGSGLASVYLWPVTRPEKKS